MRSRGLFLPIPEHRSGKRSDKDVGAICNFSQSRIRHWRPPRYIAGRRRPLGRQSGETVVAVLGAKQPENVVRAVRCAAVGAVALAQAVLVWMVTGAVYRRDLVSKLLALSGLLVFLLSVSAAVALGLSGR